MIDAPVGPRGARRRARDLPVLGVPVLRMLVLGVLVLASGCGSPSDPSSPQPAAATSDPARTRTPSADPAPRPGPATPSLDEPSVEAAVDGPRPSDGTPRDARLSIDRLGLDDALVRSYRGTTDDTPGTAIQDGGLLASPHGPRGGTGPGGVGNYLVTGHRLASTQVFLDLPSLRRGDRVRVRAAGRVHVYEVRRTRRTSFREPASLAAQRADVPGVPGRAARRAWITLSTCATPEDRAAGNDWSDEHGNPEHRIDKIGVLVATRAAPRA